MKTKIGCYSAIFGAVAFIAIMVIGTLSLNKPTVSRVEISRQPTVIQQSVDKQSEKQTHIASFGVAVGTAVCLLLIIVFLYIVYSTTSSLYSSKVTTQFVPSSGLAHRRDGHWREQERQAQDRRFAYIEEWKKFWNRLSIVKQWDTFPLNNPIVGDWTRLNNFEDHRIFMIVTAVHRNGSISVDICVDDFHQQDMWKKISFTLNPVPVHKETTKDSKPCQSSRTDDTMVGAYGRPVDRTKPLSILRDHSCQPSYSGDTLLDAVSKANVGEAWSLEDGWREVREGEILEPGQHIKMDVGTGKSYVKE
jgi:hypothetical protein